MTSLLIIDLFCGTELLFFSVLGMASMSSCLSFRFLTNVTKTHHKRLNDFQVYHSSSSKSQGHSRALLRLPQENRTALRRILTNAQVDQGKDPQEDEDLVLRNVVWTGYATYMAWLLFLPYAPVCSFVASLYFSS